MPFPRVFGALPWTVGAGLAWLTPSTARAQDLDLVWNAPAECPTGESVKAQIERAIHLAAGHTLPRLQATADIEPSAGRWVLHLHTVRDGVAGDRDLDSDSCASLARATVLVLSLALGEGDSAQLATPPVPP